MRENQSERATERERERGEGGGEGAKQAKASKTNDGAKWNKERTWVGGQTNRGSSKASPHLTTVPPCPCWATFVGRAGTIGACPCAPFLPGPGSRLSLPPCCWCSWSKAYGCFFALLPPLPQPLNHPPCFGGSFASSGLASMASWPRRARYSSNRWALREFAFQTPLCVCVRVYMSEGGQLGRRKERRERGRGADRMTSPTSGIKPTPALTALLKSIWRTSQSGISAWKEQEVKMMVVRLRPVIKPSGRYGSTCLHFLTIRQ